MAEKLETGSIALTKAIADITSQLEQYRLQQLDKQEIRKERALSREEREEAIQFLQQKDLLQRTNELIGKSGVIGEETNRLLMYLIFTSRKREHPLHVISLGNTGIGKPVAKTPIRDRDDEVCDATDDAGSNAAGRMKNIPAPTILSRN